MKIFERILKDEVISLVSDKLDPLQFAYQAGRGVEDAKAFILDKIYKHLEKPQSHAFADFSSAFNKMQPHMSNPLVSNTGSPQGCVRSPCLFVCFMCTDIHLKRAATL